MAKLGRRCLWVLEILLGISLVGCREDSSSCPVGNGRMCDIFSFPLRIRQVQPRLHFTNSQVLEGACEPPRCDTTACTDLTFVGLFRQLEVTGSPSAVSPPDTRCRFQVSSAEGESLDVVLSLVGSSSYSFCCNTGPREFVLYSWSAFVNGVEVDADFDTYLLASLLDAGVASLDVATP